MVLAQLPLSDLFGFAAVILAGVSSVLMVFRGKILKITKNLAAVRSAHVATSALAGVCIAIHVSFYVTMPINFGILLGYFAFGMAVVVWLTGTAFLERVRDSFLYHSSFSTVFIALALLHAASSSSNFPVLMSDLILISATVVLLVNIGYQLSKMRSQKVPPVIKNVGAPTIKKVEAPVIRKIGVPVLGKADDPAVKAAEAGKVG